MDAKKFLFHNWKYENYIIFYLLLAYFITLILGSYWIPMAP